MAEALERCSRHLRAKRVADAGLGTIILPPQFGEDGHLIARDRAERFAKVQMCAVEIGQIEEADPPLVGMVKQIHQLGEAEARLVRLPGAARDTGPLR